MNKNKLKKLTGEENAKKLLLYWGEDFLLENLPKFFAVPKELKYIDFACDENIQKLKILFFDLEKKEEKKEEKEKKKTAKELLDEAGYILDDNIKTFNDYLKYKKYYANGETLCKFSDKNRIKNYYVFWIIKKNIDEIKREYFRGKERRQDEYGTSCCSISISKNGRNVVQICNRYNHTVSAPDNTFNCNLDNIVFGLTDAFNRDYGFSINKSNKGVEFDNFYMMNEKYWHYDREINGKKYGDNTVEGVYYNPDQYLIFDNFILDLKNKVIKTANDEKDAFVDIFNKKIKNGARIIISKEDMPDNDNDIIIIKNENNHSK
jgi:hypothetical protein